MAAGTVRECMFFPQMAYVLSNSGFALPEQPMLPVKSDQMDSFHYQRKAIAITAVLITPVTPHLDEQRRHPPTAATQGVGKLEKNRLEESLACAHISDSTAFNAINISAAAV